MSDNNDNNTAAETAIDALKLEEKDDFVDPWNVESQSETGIDYDKLIRKHLHTSITIPLNRSANCFFFLVLLCTIEEHSS